MSALDIADQKSALRREAFSARKAARSESNSALACAYLLSHVKTVGPRQVISGYMAIQTEIDPMGAMTALHETGHTLCVPVIQGRGLPLLFREWSPNCPMIEGDFGALIPRSGDFVTPDLCIVPLVAFDSSGRRLGYGGGFYDRSLDQLRETQDVYALGLAFSGQEVAHVPSDENDQALDAIATETGIRQFAA